MKRLYRIYCIFAACFYDCMMFDHTYHTIAGESEGLYKEKGSKFIALAYPVKTEEDVKQRVAEVKKKYYDARHHCYAYILGRRPPR